MKSISNHVYWSAASTSEGDGDMIVAKWLSVANHVQNVHRGHGPKFSRCLHEDLEHREWLKPGKNFDDRIIMHVLPIKLYFNTT